MNTLLIPFVISLLFLVAVVIYALRLEKKHFDMEASYKITILGLNQDKIDLNRIIEEKTLKINNLTKELEELKSSDIDVSVDGGGAKNA